MDIEINEVQEIIKNLDSSGELSIKEEKYLKIAKLCVRLAAENVGMHETIDAVRGVEDSSSGIAGYHLNGDIAKWSDILPEIDDLETPATDAYLDGIKAEGAEACVRALVTSDDDDFADAPNICAEVARLLREGADKC